MINNTTKNGYKAALARILARDIELDEKGWVTVGTVMDLVNDAEFQRDLQRVLQPSKNEEYINLIFNQLSETLYKIQTHPKVEERAFYRANLYSDQSIGALKGWHVGKLKRMLISATEELQKLYQLGIHHD